MFGFDSSFIESLLAGNQQSFSRFYSQTLDVFARYVRSRYALNENDLQDILSDFYVKLWRVLKRFRGEQSQFTGFIWTVFKNHLKDYFKKQRERHFADFSGDEEHEDFEDGLFSQDDVSLLFAKQFDYERIIDAMKHLDELSYEVIYLKFVVGLDYSAIASQLEVSEETIRKRLSRALYRLRKLLST